MNDATDFQVPETVPTKIDIRCFEFNIGEKKAKKRPSNLQRRLRIKHLIFPMFFVKILK